MKQIPLFKVFMADTAPEAISKVLISGYTGQGKYTDELESLLRREFQNDYINTTNSATSALHLTFHTIKLMDENEERNEILTIPLTCTATNMPIVANGLKIKWCDTDLETCNVDLLDMERKINHKTKALCVVNWGGSPCDINKLKEIQNKCLSLYGYKPPIIIDNAHGWKNKYKGKIIGSTDDIYCIFSLQSIKHITGSGDGGFLCLPNEEIDEQIRLCRWFGMDRRSSISYRCSQNIKNYGYKFNMVDTCSVVVMENMKHAEWIISRHRENGLFYDKELQNIPGLRTTKVLDNCESSYWIYTLLAENRNGFIKKLKEAGVETSQVHKTNNWHDCFKEFQCSLPNTDLIDKTMICIPSNWSVGQEEREYIVDIIKQGW